MENRKVRIGVVGGYRGSSMINYCTQASHAEVVAICDKSEEVLETQRKALGEEGITYYKDYDEFIKHDMDAVVLANYANEHAPFAVKALKAGKHVFSEVLPVQCMKEAVELVEAVEESGLIYAYGENCCYMPAPYEMYKLYRSGELGEFEYGECEYLHNCENIWPSITYGEENHWRNWMYSTFYCTHSIGPLIHITGLRPVSVTGFESTLNQRADRVGKKGSTLGMEIIRLENGGIIKSIHGGLYRHSLWYSIYCGKGHAESYRDEADANGVGRLYVYTDKESGDYNGSPCCYAPSTAEASAGFAHGGSDYYTMYNFIEKILGNEEADIIDVYEALDMFLPGLFAYRSILAGGQPLQIPDVRDKVQRDVWRNDTACTDEKVAGEQLLPTRKDGTPKFGKQYYDRMYRLWRKDVEGEHGYANAAYTQGAKKK